MTLAPCLSTAEGKQHYSAKHEKDPCTNSQSFISLGEAQKRCRQAPRRVERPGRGFVDVLRFHVVAAPNVCTFVRVSL